MRLIAVLCAMLGFVALPSVARADEVFGGVHLHDVKTPIDQSGIEHGVDFSLGYRASTIAHVFSAELQPYIFGAVNSAGQTSYGAIGMSAKFRLGNAVYLRPGLGIAVHTGSAGKFYRTDKIAFGSRVLFEPEIAVGTLVSKRVSVEASWVHMSHGQLFGPENPGIDNLGLRINLAL